MADHWWFQAILSNTLFILFLTNVLLAESISKTTTKPCQKTLSLCTLKLDDDVKSFLPPPRGDKGDRGDKGEVGEPGFQGLVGEKGLIGARGNPGFPGIDGTQGQRGPKGAKGLQGEYGITDRPAESGMIGDSGPKGDVGLKGERGDAGWTGPPGFPGPTGPDGRKPEDGDEGMPGPMGPPGTPGEPGYCPCKDNSEDFDDTSTTEDTVEDLEMKVCKYSLRVSKSGEYTTGPGSFKVNCVVRKNLATLTCIPKVPTILIITYDKKLWLSERNVTIEDIYGLNHEQLSWLQKNSNTAFQTIRYHCYNSNPFPRDNVENSLKLLTWNDKTIGPVPTLTRPMFYNVPTETDGCSKAIADYHDINTTTDIKIISDTARRVPVTDFFIQDVRPGKVQSVAISSVELCFD